MSNQPKMVRAIAVTMAALTASGLCMVAMTATAAHAACGVIDSC